MTETRAVTLSPETEDSQRYAVVAETRRWIRTPYHHRGNVLGAGVDCGMLLVRAFVDSGMVEPFDPGEYPTDFMMHNDEQQYLGFVSRLCGRVDTPRLGDIAVFIFGKVYSHGGVITGLDPIMLTHAYAQAGRVVEEDLYRNTDLTKPHRKMIFYSFWAENSKAAS